MAVNGLHFPRDRAHLVRIDIKRLRRQRAFIPHHLGQVHQVVRDLFYTDVTVHRLAAMLRQLASDQPEIQASAFRDAMGIGRKRSIQILEFFDRLGLTRRIGDQRRIRPDNALAQNPDS